MVLYIIHYQTIFQRSCLQCIVELYFTKKVCTKNKIPLTKEFDVFLFIELVPVSCDFKGKGYTSSGNVVPADDGCNTCSCQPDGTMTCTHFSCLRGKHHVVKLCHSFN